MISAASIARLVGAEILGDPECSVDSANQLRYAEPEQLAFIGDEQKLKELHESRSKVVVAPHSLRDQLVADTSRTFLFVDDPFTAFLRALETIYRQPFRSQSGVSAQAVVSPNAVIAANSEVHPGAVIGDNVKIGQRCEIHPGVSIGNGCTLGDDVVLWPNVVLYANTQLRDRVTIHACTVIGADGFGYRQRDGRHVKIPHYGRVRIEDDVEIGANSTIDRAMVGETIIGEGSKIDNLVMVAHNCRLGKHNILVSQVGMAGSVTSGDYVVCGGQVGIRDHVHLGEGARFGAKTGVHKDMPGGQSYFGMLATPENNAIRSLTALKKLPELKATVQSLQKQVNALTARVEALTATNANPGISEAA